MKIFKFAVILFVISLFAVACTTEAGKGVIISKGPFATMSPQDTAQNS